MSVDDIELALATMGVPAGVTFCMDSENTAKCKHTYNKSWKRTGPSWSYLGVKDGVPSMCVSMDGARIYSGQLRGACSAVRTGKKVRAACCCLVCAAF